MKKSIICTGTLVATLILLQGCGNKGALYLPDPQEPLQPAATSENAKADAAIDKE